MISPHKFVGGPGTCGVLAVRSSAVRRDRPVVFGGGTVSYVAASRHVYVTDLERREEGGTPAIVNAIRTGLVFRLKEDIGTDRIVARERALVRRALAAWTANPAVEILGRPALAADSGGAARDRLAVFSFNVRHGARQLHHNFVVALLNDLFGIQARGGCSCAGPYAHDLLAIDDAQAERHEAAVLAGNGLLRPGWVRLSFNFFFDDEEIDYILAAVDFVAREGFRFLPLYVPCIRTGTWRHRDWTALEVPLRLDDLCLWRAEAPDRTMNGRASSYAEILARAEGLVAELAHRPAPAGPPPITLTSNLEMLRWFWLPGETTQQSDDSGKEVRSGRAEAMVRPAASEQ